MITCIESGFENVLKASLMLIDFSSNSRMSLAPGEKKFFQYLLLNYDLLGLSTACTLIYYSLRFIAPTNFRLEVGLLPRLPRRGQPDRGPLSTFKAAI